MSFWIMGCWCAVAFTLNCQKLQNKEGCDLSWRWWPWTILNTNLLEVMPLHCSKIEKAYQPATLKMKMMRRPWTVTHQEYQSPQPPFILASSDLTETLPPAAFSWMSLSPTLQVRPLSQRGTNRLQQRPLLHIKMEPSTWPGFATSLRGKDWDKPMEECCWACARDQFTGKPH